MSEAARRTVRTIVRTTLGLAAALPLIIDAAGIPHTAAAANTALAVAAAVTRVMQLDAVQQLMPRWLRTTVDQATNPDSNRTPDGGAI